MTRAALISGARPAWTAAGVRKPIPLWRWAVLYQVKNSVRKARASSSERQVRACAGAADPLVPSPQYPLVPLRAMSPKVVLSCMYTRTPSSRPLMAQRDQGDSPLSDVRILSVEQFGAGPLGTMYLADIGADIIKIEDPSQGGDVGRFVPPGSGAGTSLYFESFNRGKRSIALDLKTSAGRGILHRLVATADAVFSN